MYQSEFIKMFTCGEVKEISISIGGHLRDLHIRRLSYHECTSFRKKCQSIVRSSTINSILSVAEGRTSVFSIPNEDVELGEFYLLRKSLCAPSGELVFADDEAAFMQWLNSVNDDIANEIIKEIDIFNNITKKYAKEGEEKPTTNAEDIKKK